MNEDDLKRTNTEGGRSPPLQSPSPVGAHCMRPKKPSPVHVGARRGLARATRWVAPTGTFSAHRCQKKGRPLGNGPLCQLLDFCLPLEIDQLGQQFVGGGDDLGVSLEAALSGDHLDELLRQVDVGLLEGVGEDLAQFFAGDAGADIP